MPPMSSSTKTRDHHLSAIAQFVNKRLPPSMLIEFCIDFDIVTSDAFLTYAIGILAKCQNDDDLSETIRIADIALHYVKASSFVVS